MSKYSDKKITAKYQSCKIEGDKEITYLTPEEFAAGKPGLILAPYKIITTKTKIYDKDGVRTIWQINKWQRFKLWVRSLFYKSKKLY